LVHAARDGEISPREFYLYLIQAAGQLSTLSVDADPSAFPAFSFTDLRSTFEELFAILTSLLATSVRQACVVVPLEIRDGVYVGTLDDERIMRCQQFVLGARANLPEETVARELPGRAKIASWTQLPFLLRSATRGVSLQVTHRPPQEIPIRPGIAYFVIDTASEHWRQIIVERKVAVYVPPPFDPSQLKIEIFGIPSRG
jgi:type VI secretion system protein ImpJ